jgi:hypothetical protein
MPVLSPVVTPYYGGKQSVNPATVIPTSGAPSTKLTSLDLGTLAVDNSTGTMYGLVSLSGGNATWTVLGGGSGALATLTGNTGGAVSPTGGNINVIGAGPLAFSGSGSTLTGSITPGTFLVSTLTGSTSGGAISPTAGNITFTAGTGMTITGSGSTITFDASGAVGITTLTGNSGGAISPTAGNINILGGDLDNFVGSGSTLTLTPKAGAYPISPYVVGASGKAGYQTIQSAINAANTAGGGTVYVQQGQYTENLTLRDQVNLVGVPGISQGINQGTTITGTHTPPASGQVLINGICFTSTTNAFSSAAAGTAHITLANCESAIQNGHLFDLPNWTGIIEIWDHNPDTSGAPFAVNDGGINNTGGATILVFSAGFGSGTNVMTVSGPAFFQGVNVGAPLNLVTGANCESITNQYSAAVTLSNNSVYNSSFDTFQTGAAAAITMSSSAASSILNASIESTNNPAIAGSGAGTLTLGNITFLNNANIAGTLTLAWATTSTGKTYIETLTGTSGGAISPTAGNITFAGGAGVTIVGSGSTLTINVAGGTGTMETLTGNTGGAISPTAGNTNILGSGALAFAGSGSTLTGSITPGTALVATLTGSTSGGAISPTAGNITLTAGTGMTITGSGSSITFDASGAVGVTTLTGGSGGALSPTAGNINLLGTSNQITSAGTASTIVFSLPSSITAPGSLTTVSGLTGGTSVTCTSGNITATDGNFVLGTAGNKIQSTSVGSTTSAGANSFGTVALSSGTATVSTTAVTANSMIFLQAQAISGVGAPTSYAVTAKTAATSFVITSADPTDTSTIAWFIVN